MARSSLAVQVLLIVSHAIMTGLDVLMPFVESAAEMAGSYFYYFYFFTSLTFLPSLHA
jgi:hypothetical protein